MTGAQTTVRDGTRLGPSFLRMWAAALVAGAGEGLRIGAMPLLAATLTREPMLVAAVFAAGGLPFVLIGPVTGVWVDRVVDRRRVLWVSDVASAAVMAVLAALVGLSVAPIAALIATNFLLGAIQTVRDNAALTVVPTVVPPERLDTANSRIQSAQLLTIDLIGPPAGALLFVLPAAFVFALDALSSAVAAVLVAGIVVRAGHVAANRTPADGAAPRPSVRADIVVGFRWLLAHRLIRSLCVLVGLSGMAVTCVMSIAVLFALEELQVSGVLYGVLLGVVAVGAVTGALLAPVLTPRIGRGRALRLAFLIAPPAFLVAGTTDNPYLAAGALTAVGAAVGITNVVTVSVRQSQVPAELMGRVNASYRLVAVGAVPVGAALGGLLAQVAGLRAPFFAAAAIFVVGLVVAWRTVPADAGTPAAGNGHVEEERA